MTPMWGLRSFLFDADLRGKELVMRLMMHPDPNVQKQALLCVQKIMLARDKLEFLNAQKES
jgi:V-type H+-transporting ATPase subunit H